jgi:hypothetical protein
MKSFNDEAKRRLKIILDEHNPSRKDEATYFYGRMGKMFSLCEFSRRLSRSDCKKLREDPRYFDPNNPSSLTSVSYAAFTMVLAHELGHQLERNIPGDTNSRYTTRKKETDADARGADIFYPTGRIPFLGLNSFVLLALSEKSGGGKGSASYPDTDCRALTVYDRVLRHLFADPKRVSDFKAAGAYDLEVHTAHRVRAYVTIREIPKHRTHVDALKVVYGFNHYESDHHQ